jgi:large subunit ribosomal protein L30e
MIDVDKAIAKAVKTGRVSFGANTAIQHAKTGKAKLIILAANCPTTVFKVIEYYCKLSNVSLITYKGSSMNLAAICGKSFIISALSIREPGDSNILKLVEAESAEPYGGSE